MPPRWLCFGVIVSWLAATGWLVWSEVRDEFVADAPPPFVIDLQDEVRPENHHIRWLVWQGEAPKDRAMSMETWLEHHEKPDDSFSMHVRFPPTGILQKDVKGLELGPKEMKLKLKRMVSTYRVDRGGHLLGARAEFDFSLLLAGEKECWMVFEGDVRGGRFLGTLRFGVEGLIEQQRELEAVVSRRGSVLLPLHPVNRIRGLHPGQSWSMPLINPLADALKPSIGGQSAPKTLHAHVLPRTQMLPDLPVAIFGPTKPAVCHVIEYDSDEGAKPRTWVRAADGLVLRQEADMAGSRVTIQRDLIPDLVVEP